MAKLEGSILFTGSIDNVTAYKMRNSDKIILRRKGGVSKERIKQDPRYVRTRENNMEFGGSAVASKVFRASLGMLHSLADHNITPVINGVCKRIQSLDPVGKRGERAILFSSARPLLEGISFNRRYPISTILKGYLDFNIDRSNASLELRLPELAPGINFSLPWQKPYYQIIITLGIISDVHFDGMKYVSTLDSVNGGLVDARSPWMVNGHTSVAQTFKLQHAHPEWLENPATSLVAGIGIRMGEPDSLPHEIRMVRHLGAASVLVVR